MNLSSPNLLQNIQDQCSHLVLQTGSSDPLRDFTPDLTTRPVSSIRSRRDAVLITAPGQLGRPGSIACLRSSAVQESSCCSIQFSAASFQSSQSANNAIGGSGIGKLIMSS